MNSPTRSAARSTCQVRGEGALGGWGAATPQLPALLGEDPRTPGPPGRDGAGSSASWGARGLPPRRPGKQRAVSPARATLGPGVVNPERQDFDETGRGHWSGATSRGREGAGVSVHPSLSPLPAAPSRCWWPAREGSPCAPSVSEATGMRYPGWIAVPRFSLAETWVEWQDLTPWPCRGAGDGGRGGNWGGNSPGKLVRPVYFWKTPLQRPRPLGMSNAGCPFFQSHPSRGTSPLPDTCALSGLLARKQICVRAGEAPLPSQLPLPGPGVGVERGLLPARCLQGGGSSCN